MLLNDLLSGIPDIEPMNCPEICIRGIAYDSRRVKEGDLFVCIKGQRSDGAAFATQAIERGAAAVAAEEAPRVGPGLCAIRVPEARKFLAEAARVYFGDPASRMTLVAITGTNGKTTTSYLVDAVFRQAGLPSCLAGTTGMRIGTRQVPSDRTTPESPDLLGFLHEALLSGCTHGAVEVSSHALALKRVYGTHFAAGIFTNLTQDHLDFHGDMESYYRAKRILFTVEGQNGLETAAINTDDPYGRRLASEAGCRVLSYGFGTEAGIRAVNCHLDGNGTGLHISTPRGTVALRSPLLGRPNAYNILAATAAALSVGSDFDAIRSGIEGVEGVPGRMERVAAGQPFLILVDYAHTPDALEKMLATVRSLPHRQVITVFGCGGQRDRRKRPTMGEIAGGMSDYVIATSDNPRTEDPLSILAEIEVGLKRGPAAYVLIENRREAIQAAIERAQEGDVVVIAGKGHEDYQTIGTKTYPFDDRVVARELSERLPGTGAAG